MLVYFFLPHFYFHIVFFCCFVASVIHTDGTSWRWCVQCQKSSWKASNRLLPSASLIFCRKFGTAFGCCRRLPSLALAFLRTQDNKVSREVITIRHVNPYRSLSRSLHLSRPRDFSSYILSYFLFKPLYFFKQYI